MCNLVETKRVADAQCLVYRLLQKGNTTLGYIANEFRARYSTGNDLITMEETCERGDTKRSVNLAWLFAYIAAATRLYP